jgi:hypothetical protein
MNDGTKRRAVKTLLTFSWRVEEFRRDGDKIVTKLLKYGTFVQVRRRSLQDLVGRRGRRGTRRQGFWEVEVHQHSS